MPGGIYMFQGKDITMNVRVSAETENVLQKKEDLDETEEIDEKETDTGKF